MIKLRDFLIGALAVGTALVSSGCDNPTKNEALKQFQERPTQVQRQENLEEKLGEGNIALREFPNDSQHAEIEKYETPESEFCLVHIKQIHDNPAGYQIPTRRDISSGKVQLKDGNRMLSLDESIERIQTIYNQLNDNQKSIHQFLKSFPEREIHLEGVFENDNLENINKNIGIYYNSELKKLVDSDYFEKIEQYKWIPGAALILAKEGKTKLLPAESKEYEFNRFDSEGREDSLLRIASEYNGPKIVTIYGAGHNFRDNIERWNNKHPEKSFSLIEVTPKNGEKNGK